MRVFILIALLFALTAVGFADMALASVTDDTRVHHQIDQGDSENQEPCHSEQEQGQCSDCCCVHSHSMATLVTPTKTVLNVHKQNIIVSVDNYYSTQLSGLKRPPRL